MNHFDEMTVLLYLERQLDEDHAREVKAHAASCAACRALLGALETEGVWLRAIARSRRRIRPRAPHRSPRTRLRAMGLAHRSRPRRRRRLHGLEWFRRTLASAGGASRFHAGKFTDDAFLQRCILERMGRDAKPDGIPGDGDSGTRGDLAVAPALSARHDVRRRDGRHVLCARSAPARCCRRDASRRSQLTHCRSGRKSRTISSLAADRTVIDGDVDGDLFVFSRNVVVNGHVKGDILGLARSLEFNGIVDGNIRITSEEITIAGTVGKNVTDWSGHLTLDPKGKIGGSLTVGAGDASLDGHIGGDLLAFLGELEIDGSIGGGARIQGRRLTIGSGAVIAGATHFEGRNPAEVASGAKLGSPILFVEHKHGPDRASPIYYWHQVLLWGASFVFGLVLLLVAPGFFYDVANACKRVGPTSGLGVLFLLATPVAAVLICITIVGIPVGIATVLLYVIAVYSAQVFVGTWLGEKILGAAVGIGPTLGRLALGLAILRAIRIVPYLGVLIGSMVVVCGLGALVLTLYRYMRPHLAPAAA